MVRQEREHAVANRILVRGQFAAERHLAAGHRVRPLAMGEASRAARDTGAGTGVELAARDRRRDVQPLKLLLAGAPCGRSGVVEALAAVAALPGAVLLVRPSDAMEPAGLLQHRRRAWPRPPR